MSNRRLLPMGSGATWGIVSGADGQILKAVAANNSK